MEFLLKDEESRSQWSYESFDDIAKLFAQASAFSTHEEFRGEASAHSRRHGGVIPQSVIVKKHRTFSEAYRFLWQGQ